jgi:hypothetical protein
MYAGINTCAKNISKQEAILLFKIKNCIIFAEIF